VFANDGRGAWRPIAINASIETHLNAVKLLEKMLKQHEKTKIVKQD
jgi:hypothetical protein